MKYWMELIGMVGGLVCSPCLWITEVARQRLRADFEVKRLPVRIAKEQLLDFGQATVNE